MDEYSFWDSIKEIPGIMWGDSWTGIDSIGRYLVLGIGAIILLLIVGSFWGGIQDRRFIASCYRRGGHVHYEHRQGPPIYVDAGAVNVPIPQTYTTMTFAEGREEDCEEC